MIIALTGLRRSGKSTAAELLVEINPSFTRVAFADALKKKISEEYGMDVRELYDPGTKEKYRQLMQDYGDQCRAIDSYIFVRPIMEYIDEHPDRDYIIEDVRRIEELKESLLRKGTIIKVFSDNQLRSDRGAVANRDVDDHISETEVASFDQETIKRLGGYCIYNNRSLNEFKSELSWTYNLISNKQL